MRGLYFAGRPAFTVCLAAIFQMMFASWAGAQSAAQFPGKTAVPAGSATGTLPQSYRDTLVLYNPVSADDYTRLEPLLHDLFAPVNVRDAEGDTPLHWLARVSWAPDSQKPDAASLAVDKVLSSHPATSRRLYIGEARHLVGRVLAEKVGIDATNHLGITAFMVAATRGNTNAMSAFFEHHADVNATDCGGNSAVHWAAARGQVDALNLLAAEKADFNAPNLKGETPLGLCMNLRFPNRLAESALKSHGACADATEVAGGADSAVAEAFFRKYPAASKYTNSSGMTPLAAAARAGKTNVVSLLLRFGIPVDQRASGWTALEFAAQANRLASARLLLSAGANVNGPDGARHTPLHHAVQGGFLELTTLLLDHNADVSLRDNQGLLPVTLARISHHPEVEALLYKRGSPDDRVQLPVGSAQVAYRIYEAFSRNQIEAARADLKRHPEFLIGSTNRVTQSPLSPAVQLGRKEVVRTMLAEGIDPNLEDVNGMRALSQAMLKGDPELIQLLLSHGANPNARDRHGKIPADYAKNVPLPVDKLPNQADLRANFTKWALPLKKQGARNTCSVFTTVAGMEYALSAKFGRGTKLSEEYLNWACNQVIHNTSADRGQFFSDLLKGYERHGICLEEDMPYAKSFSPAYQPSPQATNHAHEVLSYGLRAHWIKPNDGKTGISGADIDQIKAVLARGWPVCGGSFHSLLIVGYKDDRSVEGGGEFLVRDSGGGNEQTMTYKVAGARLCDLLWFDADVGSSK